MSNFIGEDPSLFENYKKIQSKKNIESTPELQEKLYTTSLKFKEITQEPLGLKKVDQLPGIGSSTALKMREKDIEYAYQLLGIYLTMNHEENFKKYLKDEFAINKNYQICITNVINEYLNSFYNNQNDKMVDQVTGIYLKNKLDLSFVKINFPTLNISKFQEIIQLLLGISIN